MALPLLAATFGRALVEGAQVSWPMRAWKSWPYYLSAIRYDRVVTGAIAFLSICPCHLVVESWPQSHYSGTDVLATCCLQPLGKQVYFTYFKRWYIIASLQNSKVY